MNEDEWVELMRIYKKKHNGKISPSQIIQITAIISMLRTPNAAQEALEAIKRVSANRMSATRFRKKLQIGREYLKEIEHNLANKTEGD